jgi:hypothetical protein
LYSWRKTKEVEMKLGWKSKLGLVLVAVSSAIFVTHYVVFGDYGLILSSVMLSLGYTPIWAILVTFILNRLLTRREKEARLSKVNMLIGCFFSECGIALMKTLPDFDPNREHLGKHLTLTDKWSRKEFMAAQKFVRTFEYSIAINVDKLDELKRFLMEKRTFLLWLLDNPSLLEHESFSDLMMSIFHLTDELSYREDLRNLPDTDYAHLIADIRRVYSSLMLEWIEYMQYQKSSYPYFYSLSIRINPLTPNPSPVVTD